MESVGDHHEQRPAPKGAKDLYPYPEDWVALQGGKPRVFRNAQRPQSPWIVLHVYEEHPETKKRFKSGAIIETIPYDDGELKMLRKGLKRFDFDDNLIDRDFMVPSFMDRTVHGDVCGERSGLLGGGSYERIKNQQQYIAYIEELQSKGYEELRFAVNQDKFTLTPLLEIRPPKPLGQQSFLQH